MLRRAVLNRSGGLCEHIRYDTGERCGVAGTDVDHAVAAHDHRVEALQLVCDWHHSRKTARESAHGRRIARAERIRCAEAIMNGESP